MIIVTGGAGFIGSCLHKALYKQGRRTVIVDVLQDQGKWQNIAAHPPYMLVTPDELPAFLEGQSEDVGVSRETPFSYFGPVRGAQKVSAIFHLGAISETTARDGDLVWQTNVTLSQYLWRWCAEHQVPFIYASSAATYGAADKAELFRDGLESIDALRPLNLYGWSKQAFDLWVKRTVEAGEQTPPQWAGLKFFNVYGPNEYHKGKMISVVKVKYDELMRGEAVRLFRSDKADIADGQQKRDFIWVGDVVNVMLWLLEHPSVSGLFNCGTGEARSYESLARAVCNAANRPVDIQYIDMPESLKGQYQSFTQADMWALREAGYKAPFTSLEDGIGLYVEGYLASGRSYL